MVNIKTDFSERLEKTGGYKHMIEKDFIFKHLVLTPEEYEIYGDNLIEITIDNDISFVSVKRNGLIPIMHVSTIDKKEIILKEGLKVIEKDWISDLGEGLYVVNSDDIDSVESLRDYISELYEDEDEELIVVFGEYEGEYYECVFGEGHCGYIVIKNSIPDIYIEPMTVMDFVEKY